MLQPGLEMLRLANRIRELDWRSLCCSSCCPKRDGVSDGNSNTEPAVREETWEERRERGDRVQRHNGNLIVFDSRQCVAQERDTPISSDRCRIQYASKSIPINGTFRINGITVHTPQNGKGPVIFTLQCHRETEESKSWPNNGQAMSNMTITIDSIVM